MNNMSMNTIATYPHFYIVGVYLEGFTGVYLFFLIFALKHRLWVLDP